MKDMSDYINLGLSLSVVPLFKLLPRTTKTPAKWRCDVCGRELTKSYHSLSSQPNPCRCRAGWAIKAQDYHALAQKLGIVWVGKTLPLNTKVNTYWVDPVRNKTLFMSYHALAYTKVNLDKLRK